MHGKNKSHSTENCWALKNKNMASTQFKPGKKSFTNKGLKNEINLLCKHTPKDQVLDQYLAVIQKEKARLKKRTEQSQKAKKAKTAEVPSEDSDSDSDLSVNMIEQISPTRKQKHSKNMDTEIPDYEKSEEEKVYLKSIYADEDSDHPLTEDWHEPMDHSLNSKT